MQKSFQEPNVLSNLVSEMRRTPAAPYTVASLANQTGMSRAAFARSFRTSFGRTPMEFLRELRLNEAAQLLSTTTLPIKAVAIRAGYTSRSSFSQAFQVRFNVTPDDYRSAKNVSSAIDIHEISKHLRSQAGIAQDVAWEVDLSTGRVWWSEATFRALGYEAERKLVADVATFFRRVHPDDRGHVVESMQTACFGDEMTWQAQFRFLKADSTYVEIANACVIFRNRFGSATRLVGAMTLGSRCGAQTDNVEARSPSIASRTIISADG